MKNRLLLFAVGCFVWLMTSCLSSSDSSYDYEVPKDCQISAFKLSHSNIPDLGNVKFTIDQINGLIFNLDSLPFGTEIEKLICEIEYANTYSAASVDVMQEAVGDTLEWNRTDSLDFSQPVKFVVKAYDEITTKTYLAHVNIHTVIPDSLEWTQLPTQLTGQAMREHKVIAKEYNGDECYFMYAKPAGLNLPYRLYFSSAKGTMDWTQITLDGLPEDGLQLLQLTEYEGIYYLPSEDGSLYTSSDGQHWSIVQNSPSVHYLLGNVPEGGRQTSAMAVIIKENEELLFASLNKEGTWETGDKVPDQFPLTGFGQVNFTSMYHEYLMVAAGKDKNNKHLNNSWATMNGRQWALLTNEENDYFLEKEGVSLGSYDDKIFMIGGIDLTGKATNDIHQTLDKGLTWSKVDTLIVFPETFRERGYSSVIIDEDNFITIFGGRITPNGNELNQAWRGRLNRLGF